MATVWWLPNRRWICSATAVSLDSWRYHPQTRYSLRSVLECSRIEDEYDLYPKRPIRPFRHWSANFAHETVNVTEENS